MLLSSIKYPITGNYIPESYYSANCKRIDGEFRKCTDNQEKEECITVHLIKCMFYQNEIGMQTALEFKESFFNELIKEHICPPRRFPYYINLPNSEGEFLSLTLIVQYITTNFLRKYGKWYGLDEKELRDWDLGTVDIPKALNTSYYIQYDGPIEFIKKCLNDWKINPFNPGPQGYNIIEFLNNIQKYQNDLIFDFSSQIISITDDCIRIKSRLNNELICHFTSLDVTIDYNFSKLREYIKEFLLKNPNTQKEYEENIRIARENGIYIARQSDLTKNEEILRKEAEIEKLKQELAALRTRGNPQDERKYANLEQDDVIVLAENGDREAQLEIANRYTNKAQTWYKRAVAKPC